MSNRTDGPSVEPAAASLLDRATRCMLACRGPRGPLLVATTFWSDGAQLWLSLPADSAEVAALRSDPACGACVVLAGAAEPAVVVAATARVYGLHDPRSLALHAPGVAAALTALAARSAPRLVAAISRRPISPTRVLPRNRVAVRLRLDRLGSVRWPSPGPGIAPALPVVVAPDVRRVLAGRRDVVVATAGPGGLEIGPAVWGAGFALTLPPGRAAAEGAPAVVALEATDAGLPVGVALAGAVRGGALQVRRATSWRGASVHGVDVPAEPATLTLPE